MNCFTHLFLTSVIAVVITQKSFANSPENATDSAEWAKKIIAAIDSTTGKPDNEAIPQLQLWILQSSIGAHLEPEPRPANTALRNAILARPGYILYFTNEIKNITREETEHTAYHSSSDRWRDYQTLQQLPSLETIRLLGDLLSDNSGKMESNDPDADAGGSEANSIYASVSLTKMIENPPPGAEKNPYTPDALEGWRLWYSQVKAGTRTFRFKGSPVEYRLAEPGGAPAREHVAAPAGLGTNDAPSTPRQESATRHPQETSFWRNLFTALAVLLLLAGAWLAFRRRELPS